MEQKTNKELTGEKIKYIKERNEPKGLVTRYNPILRTMTILNPNKKKLIQNFSQRDIEYPTRVVLEIDSSCNYRCKYCSEGKNPPKFRIPKGKLFSLIDEIEEMNVHELTIRGGEATQHPNFNEIWDYASNKDFITTNVLTNGSMFDMQKVRELLKNHKSKIVVSLDGFPEINSLYRNPDQFNKVLGWLKPTLKERPNQVVLLSVLYKQNYEKIPKFAGYMANMGLEFFHISPLKRLGRSEIAEDNFVSYDEINNLQNHLETITCNFPSFKPTISCTCLEKFKDNKTFNIPVPLFNEIHYGTGVKVTPEGKIMANRGIMFTERFKHQYVEKACLDPLGSIYDEKSFKETWKDSLELRINQGRIADKHYKYYLGWLKTLN